jgi:hypothetical protein
MEDPRMLITDCPWCDGPAVVTDALECEGCDLVVDLAVEEPALAKAA